jgi:prepilin-type N-terminal cleavage/methylation domain-containing protein
MDCGKQSGFTLIEMSIVLVIIGLIIGGVLVGRDLISAAAVRAQISQIEKYQAAVNTFRGKYGFLPGDIPDPTATQFGFTPRNIYTGTGDGDGIILGSDSNSDGAASPANPTRGETAVFWRDLSDAQLIDGGFSTATNTGSAPNNVTGSSIDLYWPHAKIGNGNYVYVWGVANWPQNTHSQANYYTIGRITTALNWDIHGDSNEFPGLRVYEAYQIDTKIDDGLPQSGRMTQYYMTNWPTWASGDLPNANGAKNGAYDASTSPTPASTTTCYDNGGVNGQIQHYSIEINGGQNFNCLATIQFQ